MSRIKGPGIFLVQFLRDEEPYNNLTNISQWAADLGYKGVQIPTWQTPDYRPPESWGLSTIHS